MKILMYGFGKGSNMEPWLDLLQGEDLTLVCPKYEFPHKIKVIECNRLFSLKLLFHLLTHRYDVVYIQGLYNYLIILEIMLFARGKKCVQIWNNKTHRLAVNGKPHQRLIINTIFRIADRIFLEWYGIYNDFVEMFPHLKSKSAVKLWGVRFVEPKVTDPWVTDYIKGLGNAPFIFWPETMTEDEYIHVFLKAVRICNVPFRVLLFCGSQKESDYTRRLRNIGGADIKIGHYIPYSDILALWQRSTVSIKLSTKDSLSLGILEALYMEKPVLLNDWQPYQMLKDFGFDVTLTPIDPYDIALNLEELVGQFGGAKNRKLIKEHFDFNKNIKNLMNELSGL